MEQGLTNTSPKAQRASPGQQAQFDLLLGRCRQIMGESAQEWLDTLKKAPVDGAVTLGTTTLRQMVQMSEKAGQPVDPTVLINVGVQLVKDVAAVANAAGIVSDTNLEPYLQQVMQQSMAEYLRADAEDGLLSPEDKKRAAGIVGQAKPMAGDGPGADNTAMHENAEGPVMERSEGSEEEPGMLAQMQRRGMMK